MLPSPLPYVLATTQKVNAHSAPCWPASLTAGLGTGDDGLAKKDTVRSRQEVPGARHVALK